MDGLETESGETPAIDGDVCIKDNSDAMTVAVKRNVSGDISVTNLLEDGRLTNGGNLTATGNISLTTNGNLTQAAGTTFTAGKDVTLASESGDVIQVETEDEAEVNTGIKASKVMVKSAKDVDLQGEDNQFSAITVQSSDKDTPIQGSVSVLDSTEKLVLSIQPAVNGNIMVENTKEQGVIQVISELQANGDEVEGADPKGDITLKSDGSMQTDKEIAAANDVNLTSFNGAMTIGSDVFATDGDITLKSDGDMQTTGTLTAGDNVNVTSVTGNVTTDGAVQAGSNVTLTSTDGAITVNADVTAVAGDITVAAEDDVTINANVTANQDVLLTSESEGIYRHQRQRRGLAGRGQSVRCYYGAKLWQGYSHPGQRFGTG